MQKKTGIKIIQSLYAHVIIGTSAENPVISRVSELGCSLFKRTIAFLIYKSEKHNERNDVIININTLKYLKDIFNSEKKDIVKLYIFDFADIIYNCIQPFLIGKAIDDLLRNNFLWVIVLVVTYLINVLIEYINNIDDDIIYNRIKFNYKRFKDMSTDAKLLYGLMLDRMGLSMRNRWIDDDNRVYIIYKMEEIIEDIGCARQKVAKLLEELDKSVGLIERKRQGLGKPNIIYVKNFITAISSEYENHTSRSMSTENPEVPKSNLQKYENHTSRSMNTELQEVPKSYSNNTNINNNNYNNTDFNNTILSYPISDEELSDDGSDEPLDAIGWMRERRTYEMGSYL